MTVHDLKIWPQFYQAVADGSKTFEVRRNDRNYMPSDLLILREWSPEREEYTDRLLCRRVSYVLSHIDGLREGYCVLALVSP